MKSRVVLGLLLLAVFEVAVSQNCLLANNLYSSAGTAASCGYYPLLFCSNWLGEYNPNGTTLGNAYGFFCAGTASQGDRQFFDVVSTSYAALSVPSSSVQTSVVALDQNINSLVDNSIPGSWDWTKKNMIFDFGWPLPAKAVYTATDDTTVYLQILPGTQDNSIFSALPIKSANATCRSAVAAFRCAHGFYQTSSSRVSTINGVSSPAFIGIPTADQTATTWFTSPTTGSPVYTPPTATSLNPMCSERNFKSIDPLPCFKACYDLVVSCNMVLLGSASVSTFTTASAQRQITVQSFCDALSSNTAATRVGAASTATTDALRDAAALPVPQLFKPRNRGVSNFLADADSYSGNCYLFNAASSVNISFGVLFGVMFLTLHLVL